MRSFDDSSTLTSNTDVRRPKSKHYIRQDGDNAAVSYGVNSIISTPSANDDVTWSVVSKDVTPVDTRETIDSFYDDVRYEQQREDVEDEVEAKENSQQYEQQRSISSKTSSKSSSHSSRSSNRRGKRPNDSNKQEERARSNNSMSSSSFTSSKNALDNDQFWETLSTHAVSAIMSLESSSFPSIHNSPNNPRGSSTLQLNKPDTKQFFIYLLKRNAANIVTQILSSQDARQMKGDNISIQTISNIASKASITILSNTELENGLDRDTLDILKEVNEMIATVVASAILSEGMRMLTDGVDNKSMDVSQVVDQSDDRSSASATSSKGAASNKSSSSTLSSHMSKRSKGSIKGRMLKKIPSSSSSNRSWSKWPSQNTTPSLRDNAPSHQSPSNSSAQSQQTSNIYPTQGYQGTKEDDLQTVQSISTSKFGMDKYAMIRYTDSDSVHTNSYRYDTAQNTDSKSVISNSSYSSIGIPSVITKKKRGRMVNNNRNRRTLQATADGNVSVLGNSGVSESGGSDDTSSLSIRTEPISTCTPQYHHRNDAKFPTQPKPVPSESVYTEPPITNNTAMSTTMDQPSPDRSTSTVGTNSYHKSVNENTHDHSRNTTYLGDASYLDSSSFGLFLWDNQQSSEDDMSTYNPVEEELLQRFMLLQSKHEKYLAAMNKLESKLNELDNVNKTRSDSPVLMSAHDQQQKDEDPPEDQFQLLQMHAPSPPTTLPHSDSSSLPGVFTVESDHHDNNEACGINSTNNGSTMVTGVEHGNNDERSIGLHEHGSIGRLPTLHEHGSIGRLPTVHEHGSIGRLPTLREHLSSTPHSQDDQQIQQKIPEYQSVLRPPSKCFPIFEDVRWDEDGTKHLSALGECRIQSSSSPEGDVDSATPSLYDVDDSITIVGDSISPEEEAIEIVLTPDESRQSSIHSVSSLKNRLKNLFRRTKKVSFDPNPPAVSYVPPRRRRVRRSRKQIRARILKHIRRNRAKLLNELRNLSLRPRPNNDDEVVNVNAPSDEANHGNIHANEDYTAKNADTHFDTSVTRGTNQDSSPDSSVANSVTTRIRFKESSSSEKSDNMSTVSDSKSDNMSSVWDGITTTTAGVEKQSQVDLSSRVDEDIHTSTEDSYTNIHCYNGVFVIKSDGESSTGGETMNWIQSYTDDEDTTLSQYITNGTQTYNNGSSEEGIETVLSHNLDNSRGPENVSQDSSDNPSLIGYIFS